MAAYVVFLRESEVGDMEALAEYRAKGRADPPPGKPEALAAYGAIEALEGEPPDGAVILRFDTVEEARDWYNSPQYQAVVPLRLKSADYRSFIIEGL